MTCATATFPGVRACDGRAFTLPDCRPVFFGGAVVGFGTATAAVVAAGSVAIAAAWVVVASLTAPVHFGVKAPPTKYAAPVFAHHDYAMHLALDAELARLAPPSAVATSVAPPSNPTTEPARSSPAPAVATRIGPPPAKPATELAATVPLPLPKPKTKIPATAPLPTPKPITELAAAVPLPSPRPAGAPPIQAKPQVAHGPSNKTAPQVAAAVPEPTETQPHAPQQGHDNSLPNRDSRTAVYDIAAHTVYLPSGERLEAHSGLGRRIDDPRYVKEKNRGPTPPNVYDLALRKELFHGVRAIRLNPIDEDKMFGRDGMLAHTYMLGRSGQSNGCVSFKNYAAFLRAFLSGEVERLVVVTHLGNAPARTAGLRHGRNYRYAFND